MASSASTTTYGYETPLLLPTQQHGPRQEKYAYGEDAGPARRPTELLSSIRDFSANQPYEAGEEDYWEDEDVDDETRFVNFAMLSHMAVLLRDKVPRGTHVKGSIPYPRAFTGKDIVVSIIITTLVLFESFQLFFLPSSPPYNPSSNAN